MHPAAHAQVGRAREVRRRGTRATAACSAALFATACIASEPSDVESHDEALSGEPEDAPQGSTGERLACGESARGSFTSGGPLAAWSSRLASVYTLSPKRGTSVELTVLARYDASFGIGTTVTRADRKTVVADVVARSSSAPLRFAADGSTYVLTVRPLRGSAYLYDRSQSPSAWRWVAIERSGGGAFDVTLGCTPTS